jgi:glutamine amidotransferase-like uncharacterized protein
VIAVYEDYIHNKGVLLRRLARDYGPDAVRLVDARDIHDGLLKQTPPKLLIVPGGADLYFCEKLNGDGNAAIRTYVETGGAYLGICAGAYYGCSYVDWASDVADIAIQGPRELAFINATARGPVRAFLQDGRMDASWRAAIRLETSFDDVPTATVLYEGGPVFDCNDPEARILARYADLDGHPPAILGQNFGHGTVVLCAPHIEAIGDAAGRSVYQQNNTHACQHDRNVGAKLELHAQNQYTLWQKIINFCKERGQRTGHGARYTYSG